MVRDAGTALIALVADAPPLSLIRALAPLACATRLVLGPADAAALGAQPCDLILIEAAETAQARSVDLIARLRVMPEHARSPIVLLADDVAAVRYAAVAAGANDVMARTVEPLDLITRLANLLELAFLRRKADHHARAMNRTLEQAVAEATLREREIIRRLMLAAEFRDDQAGDHLPSG
jgi:putative two-component system response regulator